MKLTFQRNPLISFFFKIECHVSTLRSRLVKNFFREKLKSLPICGYLYVPPMFYFLFQHFPFLNPIKNFLQLLLSTFNFQNFFSTSSQKSTMASVHIVKHALSILSTTDILEAILEGNHIYVPKPAIEKEKRKIWYSQVLIPYSISSNICAFMVSLPMHIRKPHVF